MAGINSIAPFLSRKSKHLNIQVCYFHTFGYIVAVSALLRWGAAWAAVVCLSGCGSAASDEATDEPDFVPEYSDQGKADNGKAEFFSPSRFYFVRVSGWDPARMTPASLAEAISV